MSGQPGPARQKAKGMSGERVKDANGEKVKAENGEDGEKVKTMKTVKR